MENKYLLAIIPKPKNYFPLNLPDLKLTKENPQTLEELDNFTLKYTEEEIREAIKEANLLEVNDDMPLVVIYYEKNDIRTIPIMSKDLSFDMWKYLKNNYENKNFQNKIYNFLNNKTSIDVAKLKQTNNVSEFLKIITDLPYIIQRKLYFYLYEK